MEKWMDRWMNGTHCYKHRDILASGGSSLVFTSQDVSVTLCSSRLPWGLRQAVSSPAWRFHCLYMKTNCLAMFLAFIHLVPQAKHQKAERKPMVLRLSCLNPPYHTPSSSTPQACCSLLLGLLVEKGIICSLKRELTKCVHRRSVGTW